jgi:hypothetical protein
MIFNLRGIAQAHLSTPSASGLVMCSPDHCFDYPLCRPRQTYSSDIAHDHLIHI